MKTSDNTINTDFYNEFYNNLKKYNGVITYCDGNKGWFNPELSKIVLDIMMRNANVDILYETQVREIYKVPNNKLSLYIDTIYNE